MNFNGRLIPSHYKRKYVLDENRTVCLSRKFSLSLSLPSSRLRSTGFIPLLSRAPSVQRPANPIDLRLLIKANGKCGRSPPDLNVIRFKSPT